jgi:quinolinate synthase
MEATLEKGKTKQRFADEILRLKREKNAIILAHFYQAGEIQDLADYVGDSLGLSQQAAQTQADIIVFAGVHFMAETAKILSPEKKVLLPDLEAGCSLADSCTAEGLRAVKESNPDHIIISYINCSAEVKAMSDIICTSSNAEKIVRSVPQNQPILFIPDINLGRYVKKITGRKMLLWNGACEIHDDFSMDKIKELKRQHPKAKILAHPECSQQILAQADYIGSTAALLNFSKKDMAKEYVVVTEEGILHQMRKASPHKLFLPAPLVTHTECACGKCPYMKVNTLEKLYLCLKNETPEILLSAQIIEDARKPIIKMLELSKV